MRVLAFLFLFVFEFCFYFRETSSTRKDVVTELSVVERN